MDFFGLKRGATTARTCPCCGRNYPVAVSRPDTVYTPADFRRDFPNEKACLNYLVKQNYPAGIVCRKCGTVTKHGYLKKYHCYSCNQCGNSFHPTVGTIFEKSQTKLTRWFYAIYLMAANRNTTAKDIARETGVVYATAVRMERLIRNRLLPQNTMAYDQTDEPNNSPLD